MILRSSLADSRGAALAVVLWLLVILGGAAVALAGTSRFDAASTIHARATLEGRYAAGAGVADALERLRAGAAPVTTVGAGDRGPGQGFDAAEPGAARGPAGTSFPRLRASSSRSLDPGVVHVFADSVAGRPYRVEVLDLNSRIHVNHASEEMLAALMRESGVDADRATEVAQAIMDWIDEDELRRAEGAEAEDYRRAGLDRLPRNGPLPSVDELRWVMGMSPAILYGGRDGSTLGRPLRGIARWLTVRGSGKVNINTAPPEVLLALPGFTPAVVDVVLELRREGPITFLSQVTQHPRLSGAVSFQTAAIRLLQIVKVGAGLESVSVRSTGFAAGPDPHPGVRVEASYDLTAGRPVLEGWTEEAASPPETGESDR